MGQSFPHIEATHRHFIERQQMFFVATAASDGRVNVSPKGLDSLRVAGPNRVIWLNLTGSGNETGAHVIRCPRMTLMFCAFESEPLILRLYGTARIIHEGDADWAGLRAYFPDYVAARQIFDVNIDLVHKSCGFGVPVMHFVEARAPKTLLPYFERLGEAKTRAYALKKNRLSLDGHPTDIGQNTPAT